MKQVIRNKNRKKTNKVSRRSGKYIRHVVDGEKKGRRNTRQKGQEIMGSSGTTERKNTGKKGTRKERRKEGQKERRNKDEKKTMFPGKLRPSASLVRQYVSVGEIGAAH